MCEQIFFENCPNVCVPAMAFGLQNSKHAIRESQEVAKTEKSYPKIKGSFL